MIDVIEPNYYSMWNNTDWFYLDGEWVPPANVPPLLPPYEPGPVAIEDMIVCFGTRAIATLGPDQALQPRQFIRIAVIGDIDPMPIGTYAVVGRYGNYHAGFHSALRRQMFVEDASLDVRGYIPLAIPRYARGTPLGIGAVGPFFSYGPEGVDRTMEAMLLQPPIGVPDAGRATPINVALDVLPDACMPAEDDPAGP